MPYMKSNSNNNKQTNKQKVHKAVKNIGNILPPSRLARELNKKKKK